MAMSEDNLMISDKVWVLVGMLLRNGQSCTPSQLSDLCHMLSFTSSEIDWLCKLPFSPLCLSHCGQVTFSQFVFQFFDVAKDRYATPSINLTSWKYSYMDPVSTSSSTFPLLFSQKLHQPSLPCKLSYKQPPSEVDVCGVYPQQIADSEGVQKPCRLSSRQPSRKRLRNITFDPPSKKLNMSTIISYTQAVSARESDLYVPAVKPITLLCSPAGEAESSCTLSISLDANQFLKGPVEFEAKQKALGIYSQQSCTASVTCVGDHIAEIDHAMSVNLPLTREGSVPNIVKNKLRESLSVANKPGRAASSRKLKSLISISDSQSNAVILKSQSSQKIYEKVPDGEGEIKGSKELLCLHESLPEIAENTPMFLQNSSDNLVEGHVGVTDVSPIENNATACSKMHHGLTLEANQRHDCSEGDLNKSIAAGCKLSKQHTGKSLKDHNYKILNIKHVPKLGKLKKTSGSKKQLHTAGCSTVVEACSNQIAEDKHPSFDGFIVEAIEGSGGYGTVYKAMKKDGGKLVAIKYPFERTSFRHVQNEIRVLQKYGGQNYIPKCLEVIEESGKQCLVLDYIEHEKPEILKKEISISELQFYGFSLFKALEYLHSKGVIHRDVKPGNFLFSRSKKCGWLVDFNLAMVHTKQSNPGKYRKQAEGKVLDKSQKDCESYQRPEVTLSTAHRNSSPHHQSSSVNRTNSANMKFVEAIHPKRISTPTGTPTRDLKACSQGIASPMPAQSRKHAESTSQHNWRKLQTTESGLDTSVHNLVSLNSGRSSPSNVKVPPLKETATATRNPRPNSRAHRSPRKEQDMALNNVDIQKEEQVLPRYGRRELWELVQKSQHSTQPPISSIPSSQKKRVAAPQKRKHQRSLLDQSLPQSSALPVSKISFIKMPTTGILLKARGMQKLRKEGPCAGTKGYRAPEVLLKSLSQTDKIDIWSAGVSLFQLLLGKSPFSSSSNLDQSLLDIAQFCGADAICTLAKQHNRESSLTKELMALKVQPATLSLWCEKNTKRQNLLPLVPSSLFDLLEKCLQINPRNRLSAREALQHEFFDSCRDSVQPFTSSYM